MYPYTGLTGENDGPDSIIEYRTNDRKLTKDDHADLGRPRAQRDHSSKMLSFYHMFRK